MDLASPAVSGTSVYANGLKVNLCSHNSEQLRAANVLTYNFWNNVSPVKMLLLKDKKFQIK